MIKPILPNSTIGVFGSGQLGRMFAIEARKMGYRVHTFSPDNDTPTGQVADFETSADYDDLDAVRKFAREVDVVTFEFENVPSATVETAAQFLDVHPKGEILHITQNRLREKNFLASNSFPHTPFRHIKSDADLQIALAEMGFPAVLKTAGFGYDGKGQARIMTPADAPAAWGAMNGAPAVLEGFVTFTHEVSVIAARGLDGSVAAYDPGENVHKDGILSTTTIPARLTPSQRSDAVLLAARILNALDYVGVMGVELFVTPQGLLVNEIAPRVHNSGHWTQNGCAVDQFEQHIRAVVGLPLGDGSRHSDVVMENLIGDDIAKVPAILKERHAALHMYGKAEARPGRKMGHVNRVQVKA